MQPIPTIPAQPARQRHKLAMLVFLFSPLAVVTALCVLIAQSLNDPTIHKLPPVGAGAGETGGANFIGEFSKHHNDALPKAEPVAAYTPAEKPSTLEQPAGGKTDEQMVNPVTLDTGFFIIVSDKTGKATPSSPIYLAGTVNGWDPGNQQYKLSAQSDMRWRLHVTREMLRGSPSTVEFKFTRGAWSVEELNADFSVPANKQLPLIPAGRIKPGEPPSIEYTIVAWTDTAPNFTARHIGDEYKPIAAVGDLRRLQVQGGAGNAAGQNRDLLVWLPPGYDDAKNAGRAYPVLYMMDGQNLFEKHGNTPGEWKADETATSLITGGRARPFIIVGVPHSGATRLAEYMPPGMGGAALKDQAAQGDVHLGWLVHTVMPRVKASFRAATGPENTGIGGSSMGGLIALYAGAKRPDVFGLVLAESPALQLDTNGSLKSLIAGSQAWPSRIAMGVGGNEGFGNQKASDDFAQTARDLDAFFAKTPGTAALPRLFSFDKDAVHNEDAWAQRLPAALSFLFPPEQDGSK